MFSVLSMFKRFRSPLGLVVALGAGLLSASVQAAPLALSDVLDAKLDYSADFYVQTTGRGSYTGSVIHAPGRERREFDSKQGHQVLLLRRDIDEASVAWPERKWYVKSDFASLAQLIGGFDGITVDAKKTGSETVGREACTRYDVNSPNFKGKIWLTRDNILMRATGTARFQGREMPVEIGLRNLQRITSDPSAFVLPADYVGMPLNLSKLGLQ